MSVASIALSIGYHKGSIYRELRRNGGKENYCPRKADRACLERRKNSAKYTIPPERVEFIRLLIQPDWSPEQISNVLTASEMPVSHEWIYQYISDDKSPGGQLYRDLRQGHKRYRKGKRTKAEAIKNAVSIDERPTIVESRERFGAWEIDTVLGKHGTGAIVTLLERKSRFFLIKTMCTRLRLTMVESLRIRRRSPRR